MRNLPTLRNMPIGGTPIWAKDGHKAVGWSVPSKPYVSKAPGEDGVAYYWLADQPVSSVEWIEVVW